MTRHLTHVALALLTSLTTWSCAAQAADDVRIGAPLALTGSLADEGKKQALAYDIELLRSPASIVFQLLTLAFAAYHSVTWFNLTPKALPVQLGEEFVPGWVIAGAHFAGWAALSFTILVLAL